MPTLYNNDYLARIAAGVGGIAGVVAGPGGRVVALAGEELAVGTVIDVVGIPTYVDDVGDYSAYGLEDPGWYVFARILAREGVVVTTGASVEGAAGYRMGIGDDHVDLAVRFEVAALSQTVTVDWGTTEDTLVFRASDLATRNLDYRVTFFVYDLEPFVTWEWAPADGNYEGTAYYVADESADDGYSQAAVMAGQIIPADTYYTKSGDNYVAATGIFAGTKIYYEKDGDDYVAVATKAGEAVPVYYTQGVGYELTADETFQQGTTYYTLADGAYVAAEVTVGDTVPADTYYVQVVVYELVEGGTFAEGVTYYTKSGTTYTAAEVTVGAEVPDVVYAHAKATFEGMVRNVTYKLDVPIDCPNIFVLPEIEDETHGCWFEMRFRHLGSFSSTLQVPEGVKVATEHTQAETAGVNMVDLHYNSVAGIKAWRFLNTHSSIPTT